MVKNKTEKPKKLKKSKEVIEKLKYRKYSPGNVTLNTIIFVFRIAMIIFAFIAPILFILAIAYDPGIRYLFLYTVSLILYRDGQIYQQWYNDIAYWIFIPIAIIVLISCFVFALAIPFLTKNTWQGRAKLAFSLLFWPALFCSVIYILQYTIPFFGHYPEVGSSTSIDENNVTHWYYSALKNNYSFYSTWMIIIQSIYIIIAIFGAFSIFEADLARKCQIIYWEESISNPQNRSLMNHVLEGRINFGDFKGENLNKELKKLNKEQKDLENEKRYKYIMELKQKRQDKKDAKKLKHSKKT
ncbi:hypothetical protein SLITO_v1c09170 [Spiroplasma litorale]|uniref:Transmembrane protein n=1 Tax=Spiroplasma litorale TaxID=216942 RepID=A0A0K1W2X5_9MOLU|nr:hypothetical protein [Spiroplasma litorale]AKX34528.1 hypothetical protein SLITO_v1c09170 [Spiroplasma litorale]